MQKREIRIPNQHREARKKTSKKGAIQTFVANMKRRMGKSWIGSNSMQSTKDEDFWSDISELRFFDTKLAVLNVN